MWQSNHETWLSGAIGHLDRNPLKILEKVIFTALARFVFGKQVYPQTHFLQRWFVLSSEDVFILKFIQLVTLKIATPMKSDKRPKERTAAKLTNFSVALLLVSGYDLMHKARLHRVSMLTRFLCMWNERRVHFCKPRSSSPYEVQAKKTIKCRRDSGNLPRLEIFVLMWDNELLLQHQSCLSVKTCQALFTAFYQWPPKMIFGSSLQ